MVSQEFEDRFKKVKIFEYTNGFFYHRSPSDIRHLFLPFIFKLFGFYYSTYWAVRNRQINSDGGLSVYLTLRHKQLMFLWFGLKVTYYN